jgi:hypothetical protein
MRREPGKALHVERRVHELMNGPQSCSYPQHDGDIGEIEYRPDTKIDEIDNRAKPGAIDEIAGGAADRGTQTRQSGPCLQRWRPGDHQRRPADGERPEQEKRPRIVHNAEADVSVQMWLKPWPQSETRPRRKTDPGGDESLAGLINEESQAREFEQLTKHLACPTKPYRSSEPLRTPMAVMATLIV